MTTRSGEPLTLIRDVRGYVFEPANAAELCRQQNVHVVLTQPGHVRGNHYHRLGTEIMTVVGPALVRVRIDGVVRDHVVPDGMVERFTFEPGVAHAVQATGPEPGWLISFNTRAHDPQQPDTYRDVLIEPPP